VIHDQERSGLDENLKRQDTSRGGDEELLFLDPFLRADLVLSSYAAGDFEEVGNIESWLVG
jgi:hypothetical protein